jgi:hypothetical protein
MFIYMYISIILDTQMNSMYITSKSNLLNSLLKYLKQHRALPVYYYDISYLNTCKLYMCMIYHVLCIHICILIKSRI